MVTLLIRNLAIELKEILRENFISLNTYISKQTIIKIQDLTEKVGKEQ